MIETLESRRMLSSGTVTVVSANPPPATVSSGGTLDLNNVHLSVNTNPSPQLVGTYTGDTGIITSNPGNPATQLPTLAVATASGTFAGQSVNPGDVLVMYTYAGDANLVGKVDGDDYFKMDGGSNGDFNYDGKINADDYFVIDKNYSNQSVIDQSGGNPGAGGVTAVGGTETNFSGTAKNDRIYITNYSAYINQQPNPYPYLHVPDDGSLLVTINGQMQTTYERNLHINANAGDDYISIDLGPADADVKITINGAAGNDTIIGGAESDRIYAGDGNDVVSAGDGKDSIYGEAGDDSIRGGGSNDLIDGGDGNDTLRGDAGNDNIAGGANSDHLRGSSGNDTLNGGGGRDFLAGEDGDDSLIGGAGDDVCDGGPGANNLNGGSGHDQIYVSPTDHCDDQEQNDGETINVVDMVKSTGLTKTGAGSLVSKAVIP